MNDSVGIWDNERYFYHYYTSELICAIICELLMASKVLSHLSICHFLKKEPCRSSLQLNSSLKFFVTTLYSSRIF